MPGEMLTAAETAKQLGISPARLRRIAHDREIGTLLTPRLRVFSPADVEALRQIVRGRVGRPTKSDR
ncbi:MAG TPA: hypothetical protein VHE11_02790 [Steroidobacteraceae bacterium]|nr:hypothetical protein [Steroidobacteraceae bacterium]